MRRFRSFLAIGCFFLLSILRLEGRAQAEKRRDEEKEQACLMTMISQAENAPQFKDAVNEFVETLNLSQIEASLYFYLHFWDKEPDGIMNQIISSCYSLINSTQVQSALVGNRASMDEVEELAGNPNATNFEWTAKHQSMVHASIRTLLSLDSTAYDEMLPRIRELMGRDSRERQMWACMSIYAANATNSETARHAATEKAEATEVAFPEALRGIFMEHWKPEDREIRRVLVNCFSRINGTTAERVYTGQESTLMYLDLLDQKGDEILDKWFATDPEHEALIKLMERFEARGDFSIDHDHDPDLDEPKEHVMFETTVNIPVRDDL